jgi:hypothetical protein
MVNNCKECKEREEFEKSFETGIPYYEIKHDENIVVRGFSKDTLPHLLKWHWDEEDRLITPMDENDWKFQFDNKLPQNIDKTIYIPKGVIHRIIKGTTDLLIKIEKNADNPTGI